MSHTHTGDLPQSINKFVYSAIGSLYIYTYTYIYILPNLGGNFLYETDLCGSQI